MQFSATIDYPADVETVAAMLATEEFANAKAARAGAVEHSAEVHRDGAAFTVTTRMRLPTTMVPTTLRPLVGESLDVRSVEAWEAPAPDGSRHSTLALDILGVPVRVAGTQRLVPSAGGCTETYEGEVTASVPLVGRPIEQAAVATVERTVEAERRLGLEHLAAG